MSLPVKDGGGNNAILVSTLIGGEHAVHHVMMGSSDGGTTMRVLNTLTDGTVVISGAVTVAGVATAALQADANASLDSLDGGMADLNTEADRIGSAYWADGATPTGHRFALLAGIDPDGNVQAISTDLTGRLLAPAGMATATNQTTIATNIGDTNEAAAANDTAVSGLNGLTKRLLARMTTLLAGLPAALGPALMAASFPVAIASDQSAVPVVERALTLDGQAAQTAVVNNILEAASGSAGTACENFRSASVQVVSTGTGGTFIFEQSNNGTNWAALPVFNAALVTGVPINAAITATSSSIIYTFPVRARFVRLRIATTITGGSIRAFSRFSSEPWTAAAQLVASNVAANMNVTASGTVTANLGAAVTRAGFIAAAGIWYDDSSTALAANASFQGVTRDATQALTATAMANAATYAKEIRVSAESDQTGTLWVEYSRDGTTFRRMRSVATTAVAGGGFAAEIVFQPSWRWWRVGYTNGVTLQARFTIGSIAVAA